MPFTVGYSFFYSVILEFMGYHWSPPFAALGTKTNVVSATLVVGPFLVLHYFPFLRFPLQKPLADFLVLGGPRGLTFDPSFSKTSRFHIFRSTFWLVLPFVIFPKWADSFLSGWKILSLIPSWSIFLDSLRFQTSIHELLVLKSSDPFLHHWVADGTYLPLFFMFLGMLSWTVSVLP